ncbi:MAG: hypothetical protein V4556_12230 [Bacteroidota bacterium]
MRKNDRAKFLNSLEITSTKELTGQKINNMEYFENRQNGTKAPPEEMEEIFKCIADYLSHKWLKSNRSHPLQQLWNRKDALSTNELYFFGSCLKSLAEKDPKWVKEQITHIKSDHPNNRQGAFFEINALGILSTHSQDIKPAKGNTPGFDGTLTLDLGKTMRISIKNYGDSAHYREFNSYASKFEKKLVEVLKEKNITSIQIIIDAINGYPTQANWKKLEEALPEVLDNVEEGKAKMFSVDNFWAFMYGDLKDDYQDCHPAYNSYTLLIASPYHKNEEKNLLDKLDDACANLSKHSNTEDENKINTVFIHLPESASIMRCKEWVENYYSEYPGKPITGVILYQPTVATDLNNDANFIHHCFQLVFQNDKFSKWNSISKQINFTIPVGVANETPSEIKAILEIDGKKEITLLNDKYIFQRGHLYLQQKMEADGTITGNMNRISSGVFTHSVIQPFPDQGSFILSGHFAPIDKLLIL